MTRIAEQLQAPRAALPDRIARLLDRLKSADRENQRLHEQADRARTGDLAADATDVDGTLLVTSTTDGDARALAVAVRDRLPAVRPGVVVIGTPAGDRATLVAAVNRAARNAGRDASALVKRVLDGRGGGFPRWPKAAGSRANGSRTLSPRYPACPPAPGLGPSSCRAVPDA